MANQKWDMTAAARKRIETQIAANMAADRNDVNEFRTVADIVALCEAEDFARPRAQAIELIGRWIRDGKFSYLTAYIFERECRRADAHAEAGEAVFDALYKLSGARSDDKRQLRRAREGVKA